MMTDRDRVAAVVAGEPAIRGLAVMVRLSWRGVRGWVRAHRALNEARAAGLVRRVWVDEGDLIPTKRYWPT